MKPASHTSSEKTTPPRSRLWFWLAGIILFFVFLSLVKSILLPFVVGMLAAYFLDPAVRRLCEWKWSRTGAAAFITIAFFVVTATLAIILVPLIAHQLGALLQELPQYIHDMQNKYGSNIQGYISTLSSDQMGSIQEALSNFGGTLVNWAGTVARGAVQSGLALLNLVLLFFLTPVVAFYMLRDWNVLTASIDRLLPREYAATIREQLHLIDRTLSGFIRGQTNVCLIMASYYGLMLSVAGLKFGLVIGIMTGLMLFIPFVGFATGLSLSAIVALFQFADSTHIVAVLAVYAVGQIIEGSIITPRLVGSKVGLHPLWIIFGMLAGAALFGFVGILIAVPLTAVIGVLVRFAIGRYMQSSLYSGA